MSLLSNPFAFIQPDERGQGLVEYALILVLVSIVVLVALAAIGTNIDLIFDDIGATLEMP